MKSTRPTIEQLMSSVNSAKYPERWRGFYDRVMDGYEKNGCIYATAAYYEMLHEKYQMFAEFLDDFKTAAEETAKDDAMCRFLALLCEAMRDREAFKEDLAELDMPKTPDGSYKIQYEMLTGLAAVSMADYTYSLLTERKLPKEQIDYAMSLFENMVKTYKIRNDGRAGAMSFSWYQLAVDAKLFKTTRLQMEIGAKFTRNNYVFENTKGETVAMSDGIVVHRSGYILGCAGYTDEEGSFEAKLEETDDAYIGHIHTRHGRIEKEKTVLSKSVWKKIIEPRDPVVSVHIPPGHNMTDELIEKSFDEAKEYLDKYYPDFDYKAFVCGSWLMDEQLIDLLGEEKNISRFCARFSKVGRKSSGRAVFSFVYLLHDVNNVDYEALPEKTSLERTLKKHYLEGKSIYEQYGYIPKSKLQRKEKKNESDG